MEMSSDEDVRTLEERKRIEETDKIIKSKGLSKLIKG